MAKHRGPTPEEVAAQREGYANNYRPGPRQARLVMDSTDVVEEHSFPVGVLAVEAYEPGDWSSLRFSREQRLRYSPKQPDFAGFGTQPADELESAMLRRLQATFLKGQPVHRAAVEVPRTWWDHFKVDVLAPIAQRFGLRLRAEFVVVRPAETFYTRACPHILRRPVRDEAHVHFLLGRD